MSNSTTTRHHKTKRIGNSAFELLSSMRFAVSLLMFICVVTIIGTLLQQNQPEIIYIDQFGTFWYGVFSKFQVTEVYNAWWFLLIMGFLVVSTTVCLIRHVPKMLKEMSSFREYMRQSSLRAFPHRIEVETQTSAADSISLAKAWLKQHGYAFKETKDNEVVVLAAKKGSVNRLGYIFAHAAIIIVCIGGLLDSELLNRLQIWSDNKSPIAAQARYIADVKQDTWFGVNNPSFRGNMLVPEGGTADYAMLTFKNDDYLQRLPFRVKLNKFIIEYYETNGMPKRFASDVDITDLETGKTSQHIIEVNHPYTTHGVTLYQSSFNDGGSKLWLSAIPLYGDSSKSFDLEGKVGDSQDINIEVGGISHKTKITFDDFAPINVEDLSAPSQRKYTLQEQLIAVTGSAAGKKQTNLLNVGPMFTYTLTDEQNQSIQYKNYMYPILLENQPVFLLGVKRPTDGGFTYARIPADDAGSMQEFLALRAALNDESTRDKVAQSVGLRMSSQEIDSKTTTNLVKLSLSIFAQGGFRGLEQFISGQNVPPEQRIPEKLREPMREMMHGYVVNGMIELRNLVRQQAGKQPINYHAGQAGARWLDRAAQALSDLGFYPAPVTLQLKNFKHIQASVLQVTRSPGKILVYLGAIFLAIGIFTMLYVRDRRIWFWVTPTAAGCIIRAAMTSRKRNLDFNNEFNRFRHAFSVASNDKENS